MAANTGSEELISVLLKYDVDINAVDKEGRTALHVAIDCYHPKTAMKLIESGAKPNVLDNKGRSSVRVAREKGDEEVTKALLKHDSNINAIDRDGCTTLHHAIRWCYPEIALMLIERGAKPNAHELRSPLHEAAEKG